MTGSTETRIDEIFPARDVMWSVSCMEESANTSIYQFNTSRHYWIRHLCKTRYLGYLKQNLSFKWRRIYLDIAFRVTLFSQTGETIRWGMRHHGLNPNFLALFSILDLSLRESLGRENTERELREQLDDLSQNDENKELKRTLGWKVAERHCDSFTYWRSQ